MSCETVRVAMRMRLKPNSAFCHPPPLRPCIAYVNDAPRLDNHELHHELQAVGVEDGIRMYARIRTANQWHYQFISKDNNSRGIERTLTRNEEANIKTERR